MAGRQGALRRRTGRIRNIREIRQSAGMYVLILVRILVGIGMLDHPTDRLGLENDPSAIALFQIVGNLHSCARRRAGLWPELDLGVRLVAIDGNTPYIHLQGAHVERADIGKVLADAGANGVVYALLFLATA